eukprot:Seg3614.2 transcript_id=Seg3614.2/GoldUCD/mRNA.D3Y31 product="hypothetical protein" protein_id=Seg3614.2/GoldUCD/D3Y31
MTGSNEDNCGKFEVLPNGNLQVSGLSGIFCLKQIDSSKPTLEVCNNASADYIFHDDGECGDSKSQSVVVREITYMWNGSNHLIIRDDTLAMSQTANATQYAVLRLYSNKQMWAVGNTDKNGLYSNNGKNPWERCVRIAGDNKAQLHELDGLNLELKSNEDGINVLSV